MIGLRVMEKLLFYDLDDQNWSHENSLFARRIKVTKIFPRPYIDGSLVLCPASFYETPLNPHSDLNFLVNFYNVHHF